MNDLLFDSSIWIDYFRRVINPKTDILHTALLSDWPVWICPPIWQEVLQGIKSINELRAVHDKFNYLERLQVDAYEQADRAATLYRVLRQQGVTIRKPNDCLIAVYALRFNLRVVHNDVDFDRIASHLPISEGILRLYS
ncbi:MULTISPECIES: PIN domain nuclease [unclassified Spirosoma]|uniref:type II toxin-antitoxin system VapC family toxin n=1 Tax=unclassified Spirosoma TaxID=2621999 RepID=UPI0009650238|nr:MULTISPECIES: PIN domain nuclease [unclassified Spirosoma]MBN8823095.1 PIN domain nuclease [Spirosoma sp.]OJW73187.1 MAG: hypothetical protein BGO59_06790 [Spirosoma sp. 48-14]